MLTGDKGKTAKMIGIQCGMLTPIERTTASHKATKPDIDFAADEDVAEFKDDENKGDMKNGDKLVKQKDFIFYEIDEDIADLKSAVEKLLDIVDKGESKLELCVDGSRLSQLLVDESMEHDIR